MEIYLIMIFCIFCTGILIFKGQKIKTNAQKKAFAIITFIILFFVMGFRDSSVGTDTNLYCTIFNKSGSMTFYEILLSGDTSFLYGLYNKFIYMISNKDSAIIAANSFIICLLTVLFIKNNSNHPIISTILFVTFYHFFNAMNISRQYIAVMLVANAFKFLQNKQLKKYFLLCLVATFIHNTAIVSFILIPLFFIKLNKKNISIYLIIIAFFSLFCGNIISAFSNLFSHYEMYSNNNLLLEVGQNRKIIITVIYLFFELIADYALKQKDDEKMRLLYIINGVSIIIGILSLNTMLLSRIEIFFSIFNIIFIPEILGYFKEKILFYFIFILVMFIPMCLQLKSNNGSVLPYKNTLIKSLSIK